MLIRRLVSSASALAILACAGPAMAWTHGVGGGGGNSPVIIPGTQNTTNQPQPTVGPGRPILVNALGYNTITPTQHGSPGDYGYGVKGSIRWNAVQYSNITGVTQVGLFAWHTGTAAEIAAGIATNVDHVNVRCDNGGFFTITGQSADNGLGGGQPDWNFTIDPANFSAGMHKCDAVAVPTTGPDIIAEGPAADPYSYGYETSKAAVSRLDSGGATFGVAGNILTALDTGLLNWNSQTLGGAKVLTIGDSVSALGAGANTFIDGDSTTNASSCTAATGSPCTGDGGGGGKTYHVTQAGLAAQAVFTATISGAQMTVSSVSAGYVLSGGAVLIGPGISAATTITCGHDVSAGGSCVTNTGAGGTGTYTLNTSYTIASPTVMYVPTGMTFATERSFYFTTGVNPPVAYVSLSGSDSTGTGTATNPYLTIGKAATLVQTNGAIVGSTWRGLYGGAVCLENGSSYAYSGSASLPGTTFGYMEYRSAKAGDAICPHTADPGGATITNDLSSRAYWPQHTKFSYVNFLGYANDQSGGDSTYLVADHVTQVHDTLENSGIFGNGGYYCLESTSYFGGDGGCSSAVMVRGSTLKYAVDADGLHDVPVEVGNTIDGVGNQMEWMTGKFTTGSNVITNVQILPAELSGYKISDILLIATAYTLARADMAENNPSWNCFNSATNGITSIDDIAHTITLTSAVGSGNCPNNYTGYIFFRGQHSDLFQLQITSQHSDVYIVNNNFNVTFQSYNQAAFVETLGIASFYMGHNNFYTDLTGNENMFPTDGNNEAFISDTNYFHGTAGYNFDAILGSRSETLVNDTCLNGGYVGRGSPQHRKAAASNGCYISLP